MKNAAFEARPASPRKEMFEVALAVQPIGRRHGRGGRAGGNIATKHRRRRRHHHDFTTHNATQYLRNFTGR